MSMASRPVKVKPEPRYKGTVVCGHCFAEYNPNTQFIYGYSEGTTGDFNRVGNVQKGSCPICRTPAGGNR